MTARLEEVQARHDKAKQLGQARSQDDPIVGELERRSPRKNVLDLTRKRFEAGADVPEGRRRRRGGLHRCQGATARAAARRSRDRRRRLVLTALNDQLQALAIDTRDRQARLKYVNERLKPPPHAPGPHHAVPEPGVQPPKRPAAVRRSPVPTARAPAGRPAA